MGNINISGMGNIQADGSIYESVHISGSGKVSGTLNCRSIGVSGSGKFLGDVFCDGKTHVSGVADFEGGTDCGELHVSGVARFDKSLKCRNMHISGVCKVEGDIDGVDMGISGVCKTGSNMSGENVRISGAVNIGGLLNAENIDIKLNNSNSYVGEIGCTTLRVIPQGNAGGVFKIFGMTFGNSGSLTCTTIEGDDILLCNTIADTVRGKSVRIGPGCEIKRVEYSESIEFDGESKVREQIKI